ncbi:histidinol-phosphate/aromatic aminotransferase/cobyric acid decarboxylase-like protein [Catenulispora sp. GP43]|uniref:aminotransferase class I/II-fold pyridoxal phosphate-dependent enzyme n=1 Tax=Catenulispora sp. GP43 TaxID=3156263 RepID=UPI0035193923
MTRAAAIPPEQPPPGVDLTEAPFDLPEAFKDAVLERLSASSWRRYPSRNQRAIVAKAADRLRVAAEAVFPTRGCSEALRIAFLREALEERTLLFPSPSWFGFRVIAAGLRIPFSYYDVGDELAAVNSTAAAAAGARGAATLVMCSPNNPTGHVVEPDVVKAACADGDRGCIIDLTYDLFEDEPLLPRLAELSDGPRPTACLSLSKVFGLAGARLGLLVGDPSRMSGFKSLSEPYALDYFQLAVLDVLFDQEWAATRGSIAASVRDWRVEVARLAAERLPAARVLAPAGNFVTFSLPVSERDAEANRIIDAAAAKVFPDSDLVRLTVNEQTLNALRGET